MGNDHSLVSRYRLGNQYDAYGDNDWPHGRPVHFGQTLLINERWTERLLLGWRVDDSQFYAAPGHELFAPLPEDRNLSYPFARMQWTRTALRNHRMNLALIALTEDLHMGLDADRCRAMPRRCSGGDDWHSRAGRHRACRCLPARQPRQQVLFLSGRGVARFEEGAMHDAIVNGSAQATILSPAIATRFFTSLTADAGHNLDGDHYFDLGGNDGLRGYPLRYQNGKSAGARGRSRNAFLHRLVPVPPVQRRGRGVSSIWAALWGSPLVPTPDLGLLLKDVGAGLRLGNCALGSFPAAWFTSIWPSSSIVGPTNINRMQFRCRHQAGYRPDY